MVPSNHWCLHDTTVLFMRIKNLVTLFVIAVCKDSYVVVFIEWENDRFSANYVMSANDVDTIRGMSRLLGNAMSALVLVFALA